MKILVTGAAGFIGSKAAQTLGHLGHTVVALDNFNDYYSPSLKRARVDNLLKPLGIKVQNIDISDINRIRELISNEQPHVILHLAAQAGVRLPPDQIHKYVQSNIVGYSNMLQVAIQFEIPNFIYASSSSVYGNSQNFPYKEKDLVLSPVSFYGATKLANELLAPTLIRNSNTKARGLRFFTVYGPWGRPDMAYFRLINAGVNKGVFDLFGDGNIVRDFTFIDDVIIAIVRLINDLENRIFGFHDIVNIAGGKPASLQEMILEISSQLNETISINKLEMHNNDVNHTSADTNYLKSLITDIPSISLRDGLSKVISWAKDLNNSLMLKKWVKSSI